MKAEITMSQLHNNASLMRFFFRTQSAKTLDELIESVDEFKADVFDAIENYSNDLDEIEELFYEEDVPELCEIFGLTLMEE